MGKLIKVGDFGVQMEMEGGYKFRMVVPCLGQKVPLSCWYGSFAEVRAFAEGMCAGVELCANASDLTNEGAKNSLHEAVETMQDLHVAILTCI